MSWRDKVRAAEQVQFGKDSPGNEPTETTNTVSVVFVGAVPSETAPIQSAARDAAGTCADCRNLLQRRTCAEPVAAGLAERFTIIWPTPEHAQRCAAFDPKMPTQAKNHPYRLSATESDQCHAQPWGDATCARFVARVCRFMRQDIDVTDADDLAERLHLRDVQQDDRGMCVECRHYRPSRCGNHRVAGLNLPDLGRDIAVMLQRCPGFETAT